MTASYYTVAGSYSGSGTGDPDFQTNPCCIGSPYTNEVMSTLGADGLPVYNPNYNSATGPNPGAPTLYDVNSHGELTWWSPTQNTNVVYTGSGVVTIPYDNTNFYAPNGAGSNDDNGFQTAIFRGTLVVPTAESVQFTFGADDDAFLALGNDIISQEGGIHGVDPAPVVTSVLDPGTYDLTLFYADRHTTGAGLYFDVDTSGVTVTPPPPMSGVPEPSTWLLMIAGIGGIGLMLRQAKRRIGSGSRMPSQPDPHPSR